MELREAVNKYASLTDTSLAYRIGLHAGLLTAGIIGSARFLFDVWGVAVNVDSRLESTGESGMIQTSLTMQRKLEARYEFVPRGKIMLKGVGEEETFFLIRPLRSA